MRLYLHQYITIVTMIIIILSPKYFEGKRNRHRHGRDENEDDESALSFLDENKCVEGYCLHHSYNKLELPSPKTHVKVNLEVLDIIRVDDRKFSVQLNMYFGVVWTEPRLKLPKPFKNGTNRPEAKWLPLDPNFMRFLWVPNIFVYNLDTFDAMFSLQKLSGLWIIEKQDIFYNQATHVTLLCPMRFNRYPLDYHTCKFMVGSSNYDDTRMTFSNLKLYFDQAAANTIVDYKIEISDLDERDKTYRDYSGNYSVTGFQMTLQRNSAKYLYIYYLPTGMFVSVSWVSFLIPPDAVPGRIGLLVTLFLVATNIFNTIIDVSPNTEGMTAISSWMIAYMFFVFLALLEYAIILYFLLTRNVDKLKKKRNELLIIHDDDCFLYRNSETCQREEELQAIKEQQLLMKVDSIFLCVFPFVFVIFNALYWVLWTT